MFYKFARQIYLEEKKQFTILETYVTKISLNPYFRVMMGEDYNTFTNKSWRQTIQQILDMQTTFLDGKDFSDPRTETGSGYSVPGTETGSGYSVPGTEIGSGYSDPGLGIPSGYSDPGLGIPSGYSDPDIG